MIWSAGSNRWDLLKAIGKRILFSRDWLDRKLGVLGIWWGKSKEISLGLKKIWISPKSILEIYMLVFGEIHFGNIRFDSLTQNPPYTPPSPNTTLSPIFLETPACKSPGCISSIPVLNTIATPATYTSAMKLYKTMIYRKELVPQKQGRYRPVLMRIAYRMGKQLGRG